jgi:hypothetical protein
MERHARKIMLKDTPDTVWRQPIFIPQICSSDAGHKDDRGNVFHGDTLSRSD